MPKPAPTSSTVEVFQASTTTRPTEAEKEREEKGEPLRLKELLKKSIRYDDAFHEAYEHLEKAGDDFTKETETFEEEFELPHLSRIAAYYSAFDQFVAVIDHYVLRRVVELVNFKPPVPRPTEEAPGEAGMPISAREERS